MQLRVLMGQRLPPRRSKASIWALSPSPAVAMVGLVGALVAVLGVVGGDARWLPVAGAEMVRRGQVLHQVPYAVAPSDGWRNVPALAQLLTYGATRWSAHGLLLLQLAAVIGGLLTLVGDAARGRASRGATAVVLAVVACGAFTTLFVVRLQLFSLLLFPVLVGLLRDDARRVSARAWWAPAVLALWGNLHGAAVLGLAVTLTYLCFSRVRRKRWESVGIAAASCAALFVTPAGLDTVGYYAGVANNEAARQHVGLWARLSLDNAFDVASVSAAVLLVALSVRCRPQLWEVLAALGLASAVVGAARNGVWLLLFLAPLAARGLPTPTWRYRSALTAAVSGAAVVLALIAVVRGPVQSGASPRLVALTVAASDACIVYGEGALGEQVVEAGGRVWMTNPLDAFSPDDQRRYVGWMRSGDLDLLPRAVGAVLVVPGSRADQALTRDTSWSVVAKDPSAVLHADGSKCPGNGDGDVFDGVDPGPDRGVSPRALP